MMRAFTGLACILFLGMAHSAVVAASYTPHKMARIAYGQGREQLGVCWVDETAPNPEGLRDEGVRGLAVDSSGCVYIGDYVNGSVKKFSQAGKLLGVTSGVIDNLQSFVVDRHGNMIAHSEAADGSYIAKFDSLGKPLWTKAFPDVLNAQELHRIEQQFAVDLLRGLCMASDHGTGG